MTFEPYDGPATFHVDGAVRIPHLRLEFRESMSTGARYGLERPVVIVLERGELPKSRADLGELRLGDHQELTAWWTAKAGADQLSKTVENQKGKLSAWWTRLQRSWDEHIAEIRQNIDERRSSHDLEAAQREADSAEEDAAFAVDYAYAAVEEAEYAVPDARLARMDADELASGSTS